MKSLMLAAAILVAQIQSGEWITFNANMLCDEEYQLREILEAGQSNWAESQIVYQKYLRMVNERGEPACLWVNKPIRLKLIRSIGFFEKVYVGDNTYNLYLTEIRWQGSNGDIRVGYTLSAAEVLEGEPA